MSPPLLCAAGARIGLGGATAIPSLDFATCGARVIIAGDAEPLIRALIGTADGTATTRAPPLPMARVVAGSLTVRGEDVARRAHLRHSGMSPLDPPLPDRWRVEDYLFWAARLAGFGRRAAPDAAKAALGRLALPGYRRRPLRSLVRVERRAVVLAQALLSDPAVLICEGPLMELAPEEAAFMAPILARATAGRGAILSVGRLTPPSPEAELVRGASDVCVLRAGELLLHGAPDDLWSEGYLLEVTVHGGGANLHQELRSRGARVRGGPTHYAVTLPAAMSVTDLLGLAAEVGAPVVRCVPLLV